LCGLSAPRKELFACTHPPGGWTSRGNQKIAGQLYQWWATHERGEVCDSSGGDGSTLSPDASYLSEERLKRLQKGALRSFPRDCSGFVIELLTESDSLRNFRKRWKIRFANGAQLGLLIDPHKRQVFAHHKGGSPEQFSGNQISGEGPVQGFTLKLPECGSATKTEATLNRSRHKLHPLRICWATCRRTSRRDARPCSRLR
jgi:Uma2 family endonuclease